MSIKERQERLISQIKSIRQDRRLSSIETYVNQILSKSEGGNPFDKHAAPIDETTDWEKIACKQPHDLKKFKEEALGAFSEDISDEDIAHFINT